MGSSEVSFPWSESLGNGIQDVEKLLRRNDLEDDVKMLLDCELELPPPIPPPRILLMRARVARPPLRVPPLPSRGQTVKATRRRRKTVATFISDTCQLRMTTKQL